MLLLPLVALVTVASLSPAPTPTPRHVSFPSRDGTPLDALLFRPAGVGPFAAVITLHGCAGSYDGHGQLAARDGDWASLLVAAGYVVLLPDSFNPRGVREICTRAERPIRPEMERNADAYGALVYLQSQSFVRADRVALLGWSNGAMTVLNVIANKNPARPPQKYEFRMAVAFYPGCHHVLLRDDWQPPVTPLTIFMGASDDWTTPGACQQLTERAQAAHEPVELVLYPGAYHDFDAPDVPVHVRHNISSTPSHTATIGTNPAARAAAIARVMELLRKRLAP